MSELNVCVFCGASQGNPDHQEKAFALGELIARRGDRLVYGGSDLGLMGCVARGAKKEGGRITSIIPQFFRDDGVADPHSDTRLSVVSMAERKEKMIGMCDVFIALPGGIGTLDEIGEVLTTMSLGHKKATMILCDFDGFYSSLKDLLSKMKEQGYIPKQWRAEPVYVTSLDQIEAYL